MGEGVWGLAQELSAFFPGISLTVKRVSGNPDLGRHPRHRSGIGEMFWNFRPYVPGDPIKAIDWRRSGKQETPAVQQKEGQIIQSVYLWRDRSGSMDYRSRDRLQTKRQRAELLLLTLSILLERGKEKIFILETLQSASSQTLSYYLPSQRTDRESLPLVVLPRNSVVIAFSDFLDTFETFERALARYCHHAVSGHVIQILDPAEETFPFQGYLEIREPESQESYLIERAEEARQTYIEKMKTYQDRLRSAAHRFGWTFMTHRTDQAPREALVSLCRTLSDKA